MTRGSAQRRLCALMEGLEARGYIRRLPHRARAIEILKRPDVRPPEALAVLPSVRWHGIAKVNEEAGELLQIIGKMMAFPTGDHPDGNGDLADRLTDEMADLYAAMDEFRRRNSLDEQRLSRRRAAKQALFKTWELSGIMS